MVATRRGARVSEGAAVTPAATPTIRRTRNRTVIVTEESQPENTSDSQHDDEPANPPKRETRKSQRRRADAKQTDSTHEADVSDSESCCSVASNVPAIAEVQPTPRGRRRNVAREATAAAEQEPSEGESCSSSAPTSRSRRSTRIQKTSSTTSQENDHSEAESCSSVQSLSKVVETRMVTRSRRKTAGLLQDADPSEADSCSSPASVPQRSTVRRSTRTRRADPTEPIPINLEQSDSAEASAASGPSRTRGRRSQAKSADEDLIYDSEGCQSGPSLSPMRCIRGRVHVLDSDSDSVTTACTSLDSPCSVRGKGTPCSSRTGSASSNRAVPRTRSKAGVMCEGPGANSATLKTAETDRKESQLVKKQHKVEIMSMEVMEDVEEMEEDETNKTVINVEEECSISEDANGDSTLTDAAQQVVEESVKTEAELLKSESRQQTNSSVRGVTVSENIENKEENVEQAETEMDAGVTEEPEKIVDATVENKSAELLEEVEAIQEQPLKQSEKGVVVIEDQTNLIEEHDLKERQQHSHPADEEKSVKVAGETEDEKVEETEEMSKIDADDQTIHITLEDKEVSGAAEKVVRVIEADEYEPADEHVVEDISSSRAVTVTHSDSTCQKTENEERDVKPCAEMETEANVDYPETKQQNEVEDKSSAEAEEEPSCSTNGQVSVTGTQQTKSERRMLSLLDSSEDEDESGDEGLSEEEGKEDAESSESEDEAMGSDEHQSGSSGQMENNGLFVIDARPGLKHSDKYYIDGKHHEDEEDIADSKAADLEEDFVDEEGEDDEDSEVLFTTRKPAQTELSSAIDPGLKVKEFGGLYISFDGRKSKAVTNNLQKLIDQKKQDELLKKSVIVPDFEKKDAVPPYRESKHALKKKRKEEREKTTGDGWFNMKAPELTEELRNDLKALQMRSAMDPKRFYKKNDRKGFPKYVQVGTVVDSPVDFYHSRIPKKERKRTIVEELLADAEFRSFNKRKCQEIMAEKAAEAVGKMKRKKHKFNKKN